MWYYVYVPVHIPRDWKLQAITCMQIFLYFQKTLPSYEPPKWVQEIPSYETPEISNYIQSAKPPPPPPPPKRKRSKTSKALKFIKSLLKKPAHDLKKFKLNLLEKKKKILKAKNKNKVKPFKPSPVDPTPDFSGGSIGGSDWTPLLNRDYQIYEAIPSLGNQ